MPHLEPRELGIRLGCGILATNFLALAVRSIGASLANSPAAARARRNTPWKLPTQLVMSTTTLSARWQNHLPLARVAPLPALLLALLLTACTTAAPPPTPTPTKTPLPPTPVATATAVPPTATPPPATEAAAPVSQVAERATADRPANIAPYTGLPVDDPSLLTERPIFICINNDSVGRAAHYGLSLADFVYEYIVDGFTVTRLSAAYQSREASRIGPVRSARLPNLWMTYMYDGVLACSGGSDEVRYLLKNEVGFPYLDADIDDPSNNRYFTNLGTGYQTRLQARTDGVRQWLADNNLEKRWDWPGFLFSETPSDAQASEATTINISYPGGNAVQWRYEAGLGGYARFQGGQQQVDPATGQPIVAQNVVVMAAAHALADGVDGRPYIVEDSLGTLGVTIELQGFGDLRVFRDGRVYEGTWRADLEGPPRLIGPGEAEIPLKPGQSWFQIVRGLGEVSY